MFADDTAMLQGVEFYDDLLAQAGPSGNVQAELLFPKDKSAFTFVKGWAFPRRIYFNGDSCLMPTPDAYPLLPNGSFRPIISLLRLVMTFLVYVVFFFAYIWWIMSEPNYKPDLVWDTQENKGILMDSNVSSTAS